MHTKFKKQHLGFKDPLELSGTMQYWKMYFHTGSQKKRSKINYPLTLPISSYASNLCGCLPGQFTSSTVEK